MEIKLNTIEDVKNFTSLCTKHNKCDIDVKQGRQTIDGKSILGVFSLNLMEPLYVIANSKDDECISCFYDQIQKWVIETK